MFLENGYSYALQNFGKSIHHIMTQYDVLQNKNTILTPNLFSSMVKTVSVRISNPIC
jgi:N-dimethylarginine dimethylaminohydrolase